MRNQYGTTLIELLATLIIASSLMGFAISSWSQLRERSHGVTAINRLAIGIRDARHLALTHRKVMTLCPISDQHICHNDWDQPLILFSGNPDSSDKYIHRHYPANPKGRTTWRSFRSNKMLQMNVNGLTLAYNGTFIYCPASGNPRNARALILNKSGRTRPAEDLDGDGIPDISPEEKVSCLN